MDLGYRNASVPFAPDAANPAAVRHFFTNRRPTEPFLAGFRPLGYSLQLSDGIANYRTWVALEHPTHREFIYSEDQERLRGRGLGRTDEALARRRGRIRIQDYESPFVRGEH